jgi:hypothetical protein
MRWSIGKPLRPLGDLLRRAGYAPHRDRNSNQQSFVRRLSTGEFPRFHLYAEERGEIALNLHLDQKKPSYEGSRAHAGEYGGALVEQEKKYIQTIIENLESRIRNQESGI